LNTPNKRQRKKRERGSDMHIKRRKASRTRATGEPIG
jgi:hypothetical protein